MSTTNPYTSFTLTQPFLGAPLQFQPALGSKELEDLIDRYVTGSASKQNKLSEITIDFYNNATVDLNTGALTRTYHVASQWSANAFEQSPISQSSGSSPMFTTSPGSSNQGGSAYGSFSMTPPTNSRGRVTKKAKKDTKKSEEIRLPGFSIMTKDGIDVTSSAGRGTKTKEQREHAHLMRIMKACPSCKRKKIRCDPSHRRSDDMSRTSTTTSFSSSASHPKPSPPTTLPSLTPQTSYASASTPSFSPSNAIDDFVLFPENSWDNDMSLAGLETQDLGDFNFDINDLTQFNDPVWNVPFDASFPSDNNFGHTPLMADQYGLDQWASPSGGNMPVHTRPHPSASAGDSGGLDSSFQAGWLHDLPAVSPMTEPYAQGFSDGSLRQPHPFQNATNDASPLSSSSDWDILAASIYASPAPQGEAGTPASSLSSDSSQVRTRKRRASDEDGVESNASPPAQRISASAIDVDPSDLPKPGGLDRPSLPYGNGQGASASIHAPDVPPSDMEHLPSETPPSIADFANICQSASSALQRLGSASDAAANLGSELQRLQSVLQQVSDANADLSGSRAQLQTLGSLLQAMSDAKELQSPSQRYNKLDPESRPDFLRECQIQARRLVRSLCATINNVEAQNTGTASPADSPMLTSGRNVHFFAPEARSSPDSLDSGVSMWVESTSHWQLSSRDAESIPTAGIAANGEGCAGYHLQSELVQQGIPANNAPPDGPLALRSAQGSLLSQGQNVAATSSSFFDRSSDIGGQVHRYRSDGLENSAIIDQAMADSSNNGTYIDVTGEAGNNSPQACRSENSASLGNPLVSQLVQTNASAIAWNSETPQESPLVLQTNASVYSAQSSAVYQLVLPLLATLFASCIASSTGVYTSLSPCLQYFFIPFVFSYLLSSPTSMAKSIFNTASMVIAALASAPLFNNLESLRQASSQWVGTDPIVAIVKLTLVAVMLAQLPSVIGRFFDSADSGSRFGLAVMSFLSQFDGQSCSSAPFMSRSSYSEDSCSISRRREGSNIPSWLAAMRELTDVVVA